MAKREVLGLMGCPCCDHDKAEIKLQKCGQKLYLYCPECNVQVFARTPAQEKKMRAHCKPAEPAPEPKPEPEKKPEPAPKAAPKPEPKAKEKTPFSMFGL